jgi:sulfofructose kinase
MLAKRIVGLGLCVVDHLYRVDALDLSETRTRWSERCVSTGGMACNATVQAAQLGCNAQLLSVVGDDPEGRYLARSLRAANVGTRRLVRTRELPTTVALVLVDRRTGRRRFVVPDRRRLERRAPDFDLGCVDRGALLLVDGHFPRQALRAVERARAFGARVVADFSRPRRAELALLPYVDFPIVPQEFARVYGDGDARRALRRLRDRFGGTPVITQGAKGGLYWDGSRIRRYAARRVAVRDTTGAGDAFHGAFAAGLYHGLDLPHAVALAARAAARCCTALGGTSRLLQRDEVAGLRAAKRSVS